MKVAVIDIGSNSIRLLVAVYDGKRVIPLERQLITTRLGRGVAENNMLDETSMRDTLSALEHFKKKARNLECDIILALATSAVREAENGRDFLHIIKEKTGIDVEIISGEKEACLSFKGAIAGLGLEGPVLVIDIGGGSTELCLGDNTAFKSTSLPMGAVRFTKNYLVSDPPTIDEVLTASSAAAELLSGFAEYFNRHVQVEHLRTIGVMPESEPFRTSCNSDRCITVVGVGGTVTTLAAVVQGLAVYDPAKVHGFSLKLEDVESIFEKFCRLTVEERKSIPGIMPQRADIITAGTLILLQIMQNLKFSAVKVSESDLMEGYIIERLS